MSEPQRVTKASSNERPNLQRLLEAARNARANPGREITVVGNFVNSWPSKITHNLLEGFEQGQWIARGGKRRLINGVSKSPFIRLTYIEDSGHRGQFTGVIAALELLLEEVRLLDGDA